MDYSTIIEFCWGAFALVWIGGAIYNGWKGPAVLRRGSAYWRYLLIILAAVCALARFTPHIFAAKFQFNYIWVQMAGSVFLIISTLFTLWSRIVLGKMWSSLAVIKSDHQLRTDGPYRITRHPIYSGILGMITGSALIAGVIFLPGLFIALIILLIKINNEERLMIENFGEQYLEYKRRVPQLIPGLRLFRRPS